MANQKPVPGTGGGRYVPYAQRTGGESAVYFTRDLSAEGLQRVFSRVSGALVGKTGVKLHTGEPHGPNIIPRPWVEQLLRQKLPGAAIVETNTYYEGGRYTTQQHRETLALPRESRRSAWQEKMYFSTKSQQKKLCRFAQTNFFKLNRRKSLSQRYETGVNVNFL